MWAIGNTLISLLHPRDSMFFGLSLDQMSFKNEEGDEVVSNTVFSIGLFFIRIDIFFNTEINKDLL
jgi:hypothetical protein